MRPASRAGAPAARAPRRGRVPHSTRRPRARRRPRRARRPARPRLPRRRPAASRRTRAPKRPNSRRHPRRTIQLTRSMPIIASSAAAAAASRSSVASERSRTSWSASSSHPAHPTNDLLSGMLSVPSTKRSATSSARRTSTIIAPSSMREGSVSAGRRGGTGRRTEDCRARAIQSLHARKVRRRIRLPLEHRLDERLAILDLQRPVGQPLVAQRRLRNGAERLAACRPRAVPGPDLQVHRESLDEALQRVEELRRGHAHRSGHVGRAFQQVGAPHVAHEKKVAGERPHRMRRRRRVGHDEDEMFGRVAWGVHHVDAHTPHHEVVAIAQERRPRIGGEGVLPVLSPFPRQEQPRAGTRRQLAASREVVGVNVRFGDLRDPYPFVRGRGDVLLRVTIGIDDQCFARRLTPDQVARLGETVVIEALDEQEFLSSVPFASDSPAGVDVRPWERYRTCQVEGGSASRSERVCDARRTPSPPRCVRD